MDETKPGPDPGNSGPEAWSEELNADEMADAEDLMEALRQGYIVMEPEIRDGV
jgi:hypothetical protein